MRRWPLLTLATLLAGSPAGAEPIRLSVEDALSRATRTSEQVDMARARRERAAAAETVARSEGLPQVTADASYVRTLESEFADLFGGMGGTDGIRDLPFGRENAWRFGISASQLLFGGGRVVSRTRAAAQLRKIAELDVDAARAQAVLDAAQAYYDAVLADDLYAIAGDATRQAKALLEVSRAGFEEGTVAEFDVLRAEVAVANSEAATVARNLDRRVAFQRLKQLLDLPRDSKLVLTSPLEANGSPPPSIVRAARSAAGLLDEADDKPRAVVRQADYAVRATQESVKAARAGHLPSLSVSTQYGKVAYPVELFPSLDEFRTNWTVGVNLVVPLFTGGRVTGEVRAAHADLVEARAQRQLTEELAQLETDAARLTLEEAEAAWRASVGVAEQARRAHELAGVRYGEGVSTQLEVNDARLALAQAQANLVRAARAIQLASVRLALLSALPLPQAPPAPRLQDIVVPTPAVGTP